MKINSFKSLKIIINLTIYGQTFPVQSGHITEILIRNENPSTIPDPLFVVERGSTGCLINKTFESSEEVKSKTMTDFTVTLQQEQNVVPQKRQPMGPELVLLSRTEVDALYEILEHVLKALDHIGVNYILTGGSLLGAIRQHSLLFCDDDVDVSILDTGKGEYERVRARLPELLPKEFQYKVKPWEGGDRVRSKRVNTVFVDIFVIRRYDSFKDFRQILGQKANGQPQPPEYVDGILNTIIEAALLLPYDEECKMRSTMSIHPPPLFFPCYHFATRKAIELWPKEVYREFELFPLRRMKFGPFTNVKGPNMPVLLLRRAFGTDCFDVYYQSGSHKSTDQSKVTKEKTETKAFFEPLVLPGGTWEGGTKVPLKDDQYIPVMPTARAKRRFTGHNRAQLNLFLQEQTYQENEIISRESCYSSQHRKTSCSTTHSRVTTVYMDGVFDLFHHGHLKAIRQCMALGEKVIIGVTGDEDASSYKRPPIINQYERAIIVASISGVTSVICPCPLVVTADFIEEHSIDLVVHGFANEEDANNQSAFFQIPIETGIFQRIPYSHGRSTTDIIQKVKKIQL